MLRVSPQIVTRPADECHIDDLDVDPSTKQRRTFFAVNAPLKQINFLAAMFQHMDHVEPAKMLVFQILKFFAEHDCVGGPIGIDLLNPYLQLSLIHI